MDIIGFDGHTSFISLIKSWLCFPGKSQSQNFAVSNQSQNPVFFTAVIEIHTHAISCPPAKESAEKYLQEQIFLESSARLNLAPGKGD